MNKVKIYIYPDAQSHVHDTEGADFYYNTVPMSQQGIREHCQIVGPDEADYFYMGQFKSNRSIGYYKPDETFRYLHDVPKKHICDYEGEGGQEYGAGGSPIPLWLHKTNF